MVTKANITAVEFDRRQDRLRTRWADLIQKLQAGAINDSFEVRLRKNENTAAERDRARHSIYAIALHHGIRVKLSSEQSSILVMKSGIVELALAAASGSI